MIFKVKSLWRTAWGDWYIDIGVAEIKLIVCRLKRRFVLKNNKYCRDKISKPLALQRNWRPTNSRQNFTWCKAKKILFQRDGWAFTGYFKENASIYQKMNLGKQKFWYGLFNVIPTNCTRGDKAGFPLRFLLKRRRGIPWRSLTGCRWNPFD